MHIYRGRGGDKPAALGTGSFHKDGGQRGGGAPGPSSLSLLEPVMGCVGGGLGSGSGEDPLLYKNMQKGPAELHNGQQDLRIGFRKMLFVFLITELRSGTVF